MLMAATLGLAWSAPLWGQEPLQPAKELEAIERIHRLLDEDLIETKDLPKEMPLAKLLDLLAKKLPKEKKIALRIDKDAFGDRAAEVSATTVALAPLPKKTRLRRILELALAKTKVKSDYGIGSGEVAITTPQRSLYTGSYDVRDVLAKPEFPWPGDHGWKNIKKSAQPGKHESPQRLARLVQFLVWSADVISDARSHEAVEVVNGTRLLIRANPAKHGLIANSLATLRRVADVAVVVGVRLYEVDQASYKRIAGVKRIFGKDLEEEELIFRGQKKPAKRDPQQEAQWEALHKTLERQKPLIQGEVRLDNGQEAIVLSWQKASTCLPAPAEVRKRDDPRQSFLEGVSFLAATRVNASRRYVRLTLSEKASELRGLSTDKTALPDGSDLDSELPALDEAFYAQVLEIPDGGSLLLPVHYRPALAKAKKRWWVLAITPRICIEEEDRMIRDAGLASLVPVLVADVLRNPRLKAVRDYYGTPAAKSYAFVNSAAWHLRDEGKGMVPVPQPGGKDDPEQEPTDLKSAIRDFQLTPSRRTGNRLLGIRIDRYQPSEEENGSDAITLSLINAGGSMNGAAVGCCTLRYTARRVKDAWKVEVAADGEP